MPQVTLLVQRTGSGKSSVHQTIGMIDAGVTLVIETTISLGADQVKKIKQASLSSFGPANAFQLDVIESTSSRKCLIKHIASMPPTTHYAACLCS